MPKMGRYEQAAHGLHVLDTKQKLKANKKLSFCCPNHRPGPLNQAVGEFTARISKLPRGRESVTVVVQVKSGL